MSENILKIGVVGTGFGKIIHIPGFKHHPRTEVIAVYHRDLAKAQTTARETGIAHAYDRLEDLLNCSEVDAVSISTPPFLHHQMAKKTLEARKHLLLEKPMNLRATETRELYQLAQAKNLVAIADFEFRFIPAWQLFAEYLHQGYVGKTRLIKIEWLVPSRANPQREWNWYSQKEKGGGVLGAVGSHAFDYIHWLFGSVKRLNAHLNCAIAERPDPTEGGKLKSVTAEDTCMITLELLDGTPCQLCLSSVAYAARGHWVEVYGDQGTLVIGSDNLKDYVHGFRVMAAPAGEPLSEIAIPKRLAFPQVFTDGRLAPFIRVVDCWLTGIEQGVSLPPSLREGVYSQLLMDATYESHNQGAWVEIPNLDKFLVTMNYTVM